MDSARSTGPEVSVATWVRTGAGLTCDASYKVQVAATRGVVRSACSQQAVVSRAQNPSQISSKRLL